MPQRPHRAGLAGVAGVTVELRPREDDGRGMLLHVGDETLPLREWIEAQHRLWPRQRGDGSREGSR